MLVIGLALAAITLVVDQAVKVLLIALLTDPDRVIAVTGFLNLVYVKNFGVSFGLFDAGSSAGPWILSILSVAVAAGLVLWLRRAQSQCLGAAIGLIIGGALGNAVDRIRLARWLISLISTLLASIGLLSMSPMRPSLAGWPLSSWMGYSRAGSRTKSSERHEIRWAIFWAGRRRPGAVGLRLDRLFRPA